MIKDRDQKQKALKFAVANRWFPQVEVDVQPGRALKQKSVLVTDIDVLTSIPDVFKGFRTVVFDCKTRAKESPVNRALWLAGILQRIGADQGYCILKKDGMEVDHRLMATRLNVILLTEGEFCLYANAICSGYSSELGNVSEMDAWEQLFTIPDRSPKLDVGIRFVRSGFWMVDDPAEACRKTLACIKLIHHELDPARTDHLTLFFEMCALFARSLAVVVCHIFKAYLHPKSQTDLADALLAMLYGGRESYEHRNDLYKLVKAKHSNAITPDLSLPEWDRFLHLVRQCLDAPFELQRAPLILREIGFSVLQGDSNRKFAKTLCSESAQAARFAVLIPTYLGRAAKLPPEFAKTADDILLPLLSVK